MEKFGIFELLDTLTALTSAQEPQNGDQPPPADERPPVQKADVNDKAFAPPETASPLPKSPAAPSQADAFAALISRHESISKRIDGQKKP